jgi:hypothetical protein
LKLRKRGEGFLKKNCEVLGFFVVKLNRINSSLSSNDMYVGQPHKWVDSFPHNLFGRSI